MLTALFWIVALVGHGALWVELVNRLHGLGWNRRLIDLATAACAAATVGLPVLAVWAWAARTGIASPAGRALTGYAWFCLATLAVLAVQRALLRFDPQRCGRTRLTRIETVDLDELLGREATGPPLVARLAKLPGNQLLKLAVEHRETPIDRLPEPLNGLRVAHLTDLHMSGRLGMAYFQEVVRRVNEWSPDLVCVTGDIVEQTPQLEWVAETLGRLDPPRLGAYFILGNHDEKVDCERLRAELASAGLTDVGGRSVTAECGEAVITLCGDERPWFGDEPPLEGGPQLVICLAHTPDRFASARRRGIDLVLAGHNHGGQVCFPLIGPLLCPSRHGVRYADGTFRAEGTLMHVSRGTGSLFPLRYGCPPELTLLTLTRG